MTRSQSEAIAKTIIAAVEPLATKADLEAVNTRIESAKVWLLSALLGGFLALSSSILVAAFRLI